MLRNILKGAFHSQFVIIVSFSLTLFVSKAAYVCGNLLAGLGKAGTPLDLADLEIAAIAIANEMPWSAATWVISRAWF